MKLLQYVVIVVLLLSLMPTGMADLYRWVDADGQLHYSDTPRPGAEQITLKKTNVSRSFKPAVRADTGALEKLEEDQSFTAYTAVAVTSPAAEETLWDTGGVVNVSISLQPALQKGHGVVIYLDGRPMAPQPQARTSFTIQNVFRGTHTVRASVYSDTGKILFNSESITFHVKQNTANRGG